MFGITNYDDNYVWTHVERSQRIKLNFQELGIISNNNNFDTYIE